MKRALKYIALMALPLLAFTNCDEDNKYTELLKNDLYNLTKETIKISVDQKTITFDANAHFAELQFEANFWWRIDTVLVPSVNQEVAPLEVHSWFSITPPDNFGKRPVTITLNQNIEKFDRKVILKFYAEDGTLVNTFELIQKASDPLVEITPGRKDFSLLANLLSVKLTTTENWSVELPSWCTIQTATGSKCKDNVLAISVMKNDTKVERTGVVKISGGGIIKEFEIVQGGTFEKPKNLVVTNTEKLEVQWQRSTGAVGYKLNYYEPGTNNLIDTVAVATLASYPEQILVDISNVSSWKGYVGNVDVSVSATLGQNLWEESENRVRMNTHFGTADLSDGTEASPFIITNKRHFLNINKKLNGYYLQSSDLDLASATNYAPINNFTGVYNGNNHSISNLMLVANVNTPYGIFGTINGASAAVKNLKLNDCTVKIEQSLFPNEVGLLAGRLTDGTIENIEINNFQFTSVKNCNIGVGGVLGYNYKGKVLNCKAKSGLMSTAKINTTTGFILSGQIIPMGGIVGRNGAAIVSDPISLIENCENIDLKILTGTSQVGGIVGQNNHTVRKCTNYALVRASQHVGGIAGGSTSADATSASVLIELCANYGEISIENAGNQTQVGGINGRSISGLSGTKMATIRKCFNAGKIVLKSTTVANSLQALGGIAGRLNTYKVQDCYNSGQIMSLIPGVSDVLYGVNLGGLFGNFESATVENCYSVGTVSGSGFYNGLFAARKVGVPSTATNCYYLLQGTSQVGGYAYIATTALGTNPTGLSEADLKNQNMLSGFDFNTIWQLDAAINNGYPSLRERVNISPFSNVRRKIRN